VDILAVASRYRNRYALEKFKNLEAAAGTYDAAAVAIGRQAFADLIRRIGDLWIVVALIAQMTMVAYAKLQNARELAVLHGAD